MRHEGRQVCFREDLAGRAAEDELTHAALGVAAFDEEIGAEAISRFEHGMAWSFWRVVCGHGSRRHAMSSKTGHELVLVGAGEIE